MRSASKTRLAHRDCSRDRGRTAPTSGGPAPVTLADGDHHVTPPRAGITTMTRRHAVIWENDELFTGPLVEQIPTTEADYSDKAPGDADGEDQGDHC